MGRAVRARAGGEVVIVSSHQPDLLPYSGFWYKMANCDIFDVKIWDQFVNRGYQRRVKMRDNWFSVPVMDGASYEPIFAKRIDPNASSRLLGQAIIGRYGGSRFWKQRGPRILELVDRLHTDRLWQFNLELILGIRDLLGIETPISLSMPTVGKGSVGLVSVLRRYGRCTYLSGTGAKVYMGDCREFTQAGIDVIWSNHQAVTGDSILSVIMDYEDPMEIVMSELPEKVEVGS
jgi:hypothetical protein